MNMIRMYEIMKWVNGDFWTSYISLQTCSILIRRVYSSVTLWYIYKDVSIGQIILNCLDELPMYLFFSLPKQEDLSSHVPTLLLTYMLFCGRFPRCNSWPTKRRGDVGLLTLGLVATLLLLFCMSTLLGISTVKPAMKEKLTLTGLSIYS